MNAKDQKIEELMLENGRLRVENERLAKNQLRHCENCDRLMRHDCYTLFVCPHLGTVNPLEDGCTKWKLRG